MLPVGARRANLCPCGSTSFLFLSFSSFFSSFYFYSRPRDRDTSPVYMLKKILFLIADYILNSPENSPLATRSSLSTTLLPSSNLRARVPFRSDESESNPPSFLVHPIIRIRKAGERSEKCRGLTLGLNAESLLPTSRPELNRVAAFFVFSHPFVLYFRSFRARSMLSLSPFLFLSLFC